MRELMFIGDGKVEWRESADPVIEEPTDAVVRPVASTTCDLDQLILSGKAPTRPPFAIGHECVAKVVEVGPEVTHVGPGDLVVVPWHVACGRCERCQKGLHAYCTTAPYAAMFGLPLGGNFGGLFSDLVRVPWADAMLVALPAELDPIAMSSAGDNWSLAFRLVAPHLECTPGGSVLIFGFASIGLYVTLMAGVLGASRRLYVDPNPEHRAIAESFGAETAASIDPIHHGFDIAVEAAGSVEALATACCSLVPEGHCESAGNHYTPGEMPLLAMYVNGVNFRIARDSVRAHVEPALELAKRSDVDPLDVISHVFDWEELPEELPRGHTKPVFVRDPVSIPERFR